MKKKIAVIISLVLLVSIVGASSVFALDNKNTDDNGFLKSMFDNMKSWVQQALDKGQITKDQADNWGEHINDMQKYHEENGAGHCGNNNNGASGKPGDAESGSGQSYTQPNGGGMMNGNSSTGSGYGVMGV